MATWKKIITSGSSAELSSLTLDTALPVAQGGIGASSLTDKAVLISQDSGTDTVGAVALTSNGQIIIGGSDGPAAATISGTSNEVEITNGANSIQIGLPNNVTIGGILTVSGHLAGTVITGSIISASTFQGDGSNLTGVTQDIDTLGNYGAQTIHQTDDHFLISDDGTEKKITFSDLEDSIFANVSGEATIAGGGALTIAANVIGNNELKQDDDITLQALTTTNNLSVGGNATITGDLTVNGTTTTIATTNTEVADQFLFLASGSAGSNLDSGIIVQSGSAHNSGSAFYHDKSDQRWSVAKNMGKTHGGATQAPTQFVTTVKTETVNPNSTSGSYGAGEMHVNTTTGDIWIRFG
jgi:hypothetical protein